MRKPANTFIRVPSATLGCDKSLHNQTMNVEQHVGQVVAQTILSIEGEAQRKQAAKQLISYAIASLVALEGDRAAAEFVYRAADATVGVA